VDRPGRSVIVLLAFLRTLIDMAENAETQLRIFVEDLPLRCGLRQMVADELRVGARFLHQRAHSLAALGPGIRGQDAVTIGGELFESVAHQADPHDLDRQVVCRERRDYARPAFAARLSARTRRAAAVVPSI